MKALVQRVSEASVSVDGAVIGRAGPGVLVLVCAMQGDTDALPSRMAAKIAKLRIFRDEAGRMNRSLLDTGGAALVVGLSTVDVPLLGDTLVPSPDFVALGLTTGPWGDLTLEGEWFRAGEVPPGVELFFQMWSFHPTYGPFEAQATNALMVTTE